MSHKIGSTLLLSRYVCLMMFFCWLFRFVDLNRWSSISIECQHDTQYLSWWKWSLMCTLSPVGSFSVQYFVYLCSHYCTPILDMCFCRPVWKCPSLFKDVPLNMLSVVFSIVLRTFPSWDYPILLSLVLLLVYCICPYLVVP